MVTALPSLSYKPDLYSATDDGGGIRRRVGYQQAKTPPQRTKGGRISKTKRRVRRAAREAALEASALMKQEMSRIKTEQHASPEKIMNSVPSNAGRADPSSLSGPEGQQANEVDYEMVESGILAHLNQQEKVSQQK